MSVPPVEGFAIVRVNMSMSRNSKIALAAVVIMGLVCLVIAGIAVAGMNGIGPMSRACSVIALAVTVPIFLSTIVLASLMKTVTLSKEQKSFKKLQTLFYERRSECEKKANQLKRKIVVKGSFVGFPTISPGQLVGASFKTMRLLEKYMYILPSMHTNLLQIVNNNKNGINDSKVIAAYKECMEVATAVRELAIMSAIGVETGIVSLSALFEMRNPEKNCVGLLMYYPEALAMCFERKFECLDLYLTQVRTRGFTEFYLRNVLVDNAKKVAETNQEIDDIKKIELRKLERLLLLIDETSKTVDKLDNNYLMHLAKSRMSLINLHEYEYVMNNVLTSLLYHEVCSRACLDKMPYDVPLN